MAHEDSGSEPIGSLADLAGWFAGGEKPHAAWRIGTEHEKIPFRKKDLNPVPYEGPDGIRALLEGLAARTGWKPVLEGDHPIALVAADGSAISLEPGGQFELSGAPVADLHATNAETMQHIADSKAVAEKLGIDFLDLAVNPIWRREQIPQMPKGRYRIMTAYMPKVGTMGLDMMYRTATVQTNLDFASEADMVAKMRVALALQPVATALFANSPFSDGKPNGYLSLRSRIWLDTDANRTGMLDFVFQDGFGYQHYADWALTVPMYFVRRNGVYHDATGASFKDFLAGKLATLPGVQATMDDWVDHLSTLFPEVRLKRYLEMRGADVGPSERIVALSALWTGLLYDPQALDSAWQLVKTWSSEQRQTLRRDAPRLGLKAVVGGRPVLDIARDMLALARTGLTRRSVKNAAGQDESLYLDPLDRIVAHGQSPAEDLLDCYRSAWNGSLEPAFSERVF